MKKAKYTPAPWAVDYGGQIASKDRRAIGQVIATVQGETKNEIQFNKHLICAAPDLLEAAEEILARWESGDLAEAVRWLNDAVRKAKGEL